jgi:peptidoglycan/LPS O-acetylase OafA/YrhL
MPNVETCFYHSWYLALDLQLFIFAPFLVFWYQYRPRAGMLATGILMSLSIGATISLAHWRKWSINTFDGAAVARFDVEGYAKPHIRCQTYLAGMLLGMILQQQTSSLRQTIQTRLSMMFAVGLLAFVTFITVTGAYSRRACNFEEWPELDNCGSLWSPNQTFLYAASSRALWALAIGIICFLCLQGAGGMVNALLSHPAWTPLSHLSFGAYLLHPIVIFVYQFGDRQKEPFRLLSFSLDYLSLSVVSFFLALAFALVVELPIANLSKRLYPTRRDPGERWRTESEVLVSSVNLNGHRYGSFVHPQI